MPAIAPPDRLELPDEIGVGLGAAAGIFEPSLTSVARMHCIFAAAWLIDSGTLPLATGMNTVRIGTAGDREVSN